ncbi:FecR family protein [Kerstersia gyiorum]|nr:FecR family protein [Kerstersia gyiorum]MCO7643608.1 FecR family protein [Pseudomonas sp. S 311-6]MCP1633449.1 transmembrane sensor [Kerstersia gyiorum]MCP1636320.1 transmembrane sensor [Kerstersia gyiorum]MCP1671113.1 transmembrane sensor [Kerstersia gyiorum]MCP1679230.1 transmembrane sensor [Kerstersia gyiorum]
MSSSAMPAQQGSEGEIPGSVLGEAADWLMRMQEGDLNRQEIRHFQAWCQRSAHHAEAWRRVQAVLGTFTQVPDTLGRRLIPELAAGARRRQRGRRQILAGLGALAIVGPASWMMVRRVQPHWDWSADYRTRIGEIRELVLPDGSLVVMNTGSAIALQFSEAERRVNLLAGEVMIQTRPDTQARARPFLVQTAQGTAQALGTRFSVRTGDGVTRVEVFEGRVMVRRTDGDEPLAVLPPGQALTFSRDGEQQAEAVDETALMWRNDMLLVRDMPLQALLQELGRYRNGLLRCSEGAANLRVSGAFPLLDTDASLALLTETLPVKVLRRTRYWVTVVLDAEEA